MHKVMRRSHKHLKRAAKTSQNVSRHFFTTSQKNGRHSSNSNSSSFFRSKTRTNCMQFCECRALTNNSRRSAGQFYRSFSATKGSNFCTQTSRNTPNTFNIVNTSNSTSSKVPKSTPQPNPSSRTTLNQQNTIKQQKATSTRHLLKLRRPFRTQSVNRQQMDVQTRHSMNGHKSPLYSPEENSMRDITEISRKQQTAVSMKEMFEMGKDPSPDTLLRNAQFLWEELPIRLAKRVVELKSLPYALPQMPSIQEVAQIYINSFNTIRLFPKPMTQVDEELFTQTIGEIMDNHSNVVPKIAEGLIEMNDKFDPDPERIEILRHCPFLMDFLNRFYSARIGIRFLIGHHVEMHRTRSNPNTTFVGFIDGQCRPAFIAEDAVNDASRVCQQTLGDYPEVIIRDPNEVTCIYASSHLHYMLFELLKNSMRAVVEHCGIDCDSFPPISVDITHNSEEITIKISDQGGGIKRRDMKKILSYAYTTAHTPKATEVGGLINAPMAGFGYGLPITALYANYFGGDLKINSMDGYGTDAYLTLLNVGADYHKALH